jgi:iron(III) transport system permease protein
VLPVGVILYWTARGLRNQQNLNLKWEPILNSLLAAALAGGTAVVAAMPIVVLAVRYRGRLVSFLDRLTYVGNALPGIVIALSLVFFGARHAPWIYQTLPMLIFAYVIRFLPQAVGSIRGNMLQVPPRFEEAARSLGKKRFAAFATVTLPMLAPGILAGGALVFLTTIKELPVTLLLSPAGFNTLVMEVWSTASEGLFSQASPPALLIIVVSALSIGLILRQERRGGYGRS